MLAGNAHIQGYLSARRLHEAGRLQRTVICSQGCADAAGPGAAARGRCRPRTLPPATLQAAAKDGPGCLHVTLGRKDVRNVMKI
jgi:hypothetical protein